MKDQKTDDRKQRTDKLIDFKASVVFVFCRPFSVFCSLKDREI